MASVELTSFGLSYVEDFLAHLEDGGSQVWRHFHWGLFEGPEIEDLHPGHYLIAAMAMTDRIVQAAEVADGSRVLDVGCGFGGTLDHIRQRYESCALAGVNIDERQLQTGRQLLAKAGEGGEHIPFITADGCQLPVADASVDHVLAVECIFHFPSRKRFFREAARVLRPGGTLALSDFVARSPARLMVAGLTEGYGESNWYGRSTLPITSTGYRRLARGTGFDVLVDDDVSTPSLPNYPAFRALYEETGASEGVRAIDGMAPLARSGDLQYHVFGFRKRGTDGEG